MGRLRPILLRWIAEAQVPFHLRYWRFVRLAIFVMLDIACVTLAYYGAFALRLDSFWPAAFAESMLWSWALLLVISIPVFSFFGMYRQVWRYASLNSAILICKSVAVSMALAFALFSLAPKGLSIPRSVPLIYFCLGTLILGFVKFSWRALASYQSRYQAGIKKRCLIYGAGSGGDILVRHIKANDRFPYHIVGFIDDDRNKRRRLLHEFPIFGTGEDLAAVCEKHDVGTVLIAMPSASGKEIRRVVKTCQAANVRPLIMAGLTSTLTEEVMKPRPVDVADLLRRAPKEIDETLIRNFFKGRSVLITGAGGSIGSELARQVRSFQPSSLILLDSSEFNLYRIDLELKEHPNNDTPIFSVLGSVTDQRLVHSVFEKFRPSIVLHAAAYKHVPMLESNPVEGTINNIYGTKLLTEAAVAFGVKRFLLISTDKAVRPTNVMGCTKRLCEMLVNSMHQLHQTKCRFAVVRFGNVLGSSGSVIPRFMEQIAKGGPVTVTHPDVTRFFMLTSEAVSLVLQSIAMSSGGETFVLNMGEPVRIYDMAQQLIELAGKVPGKDVEIKITGLRPGEKLYEELILEGSEQHTVHDDVFVAVPDSFDPHRTLENINAVLEAAIEGHDTEALVRQLKGLVECVSTAATHSLEHADPLTVRH